MDLNHLCLIQFQVGVCARGAITTVLLSKIIILHVVTSMELTVTHCHAAQPIDKTFTVWKFTEHACANSLHMEEAD